MVIQRNHRNLARNTLGRRGRIDAVDFVYCSPNQEAG